MERLPHQCRTQGASDSDRMLVLQPTVGNTHFLWKANNQRSDTEGQQEQNVGSQPTVETLTACGKHTNAGLTGDQQRQNVASQPVGQLRETLTPLVESTPMCRTQVDQQGWHVRMLAQNPQLKHSLPQNTHYSRRDQHGRMLAQTHRVETLTCYGRHTRA